MFIHQGENRTSKHDLQIASLLSLVAGIVNVAGFLAVARLTTNVTGHFAFFVDEVFKMKLWEGFVYFIYIFFFFLGSFFSSFLIEIILRRNKNYVYIIPAFIESMILVLIAIFGYYLLSSNPNLIVCSLLFAMGLQNSLVTRISNASIRTTHLTGLFTDLGIELSQLFFYRERKTTKKLITSIRLRFTIISFFFVGGIIGGVFYSKMKLYVLLIAATLLVIGVTYDNIRSKLENPDQGLSD